MASARAPGNGSVGALSIRQRESAPALCAGPLPASPGFSLHAATRVEATDRDGLERLNQPPKHSISGKSQIEPTPSSIRRGQASATPPALPRQSDSHSAATERPLHPGPSKAGGLPLPAKRTWRGVIATAGRDNLRELPRWPAGRRLDRRSARRSLRLLCRCWLRVRTGVHDRLSLIHI